MQPRPTGMVFRPVRLFSPASKHPTGDEPRHTGGANLTFRPTSFSGGSNYPDILYGQFRSTATDRDEKVRFDPLTGSNNPDRSYHSSLSPDDRIDVPIPAPSVLPVLEGLARAHGLEQSIAQPRSVAPLKVEGIAEHPSLVPASGVRRVQAIILDLTDIEDSLNTVRQKVGHGGRLAAARRWRTRWKDAIARTSRTPHRASRAGRGDTRPGGGGLKVASVRLTRCNGARGKTATAGLSRACRTPARKRTLSASVSTEEY